MIGSTRWLLFIFVILTSVVAVVYLGARVAERMAALQAAPQDNVQWSLAQLDVELLALEVAAQNASSGSAESLQEMRRRFNVFYSRTNTISALPVFRVKGLSQNYESSLYLITWQLQDMAPDFDAPDDVLKTKVPKIIDEIEKMRPAARKITLEGVKQYSADADRSRGEFARLLQQTALVNTILIVAIGAALLFLFRQIRISRLRAAEIEAGSARNASTVSASLDAIIVINMDGKVVEFNPAAVQTFGYSRNAAVGAALEDLIIPPRHRAAHRRGVERLRSTGQQKVVGMGRVEMAALRSDGTEFPVEMSLALSDSPEGRIVTAFLRDISQRVKYEDDLRRARDEALQAAHAKSQFLAVMSHEMRTPLNGVMALLDLLAGTRLTHKQLSYVKTAATSAEILKQHVDDVLDLTRIQAGKMELFPRALNLVELLEEVQSLNLATAAKRGNRIKLNVDMPQPYFVADRKRLHQVLTNLASNAIKFTENGSIDISARFTGVRADTVDVLFEVSDTGIGIAPEHLDKIFEEFVTLDTSLQRNASGAGLGLPICKQIVDSMGGTIGVESEPGKGTRFWFRVPLKAAFPEKQEAPASAAPGRQKKDKFKLDVLVVEDNETNRFVAQELLASLGCHVTLANDGAQGVQAARAGAFDLILMDISMPVMNGWDAARAIRVGDGKSAVARILALTAHVIPDAQNLLDDSGIDGILLKPLRRDEIRAEIEAFANMKKPSPVAAKPAAVAARTGSALVDFTQAAELAELLGRDGFEARLGQFETEMHDGLARLHELAQGEKLREFGDLAHKLKGSAGVFGALALGARLDELQLAAKSRHIPRRTLQKARELLAPTCARLREV